MGVAEEIDNAIEQGVNELIIEDQDIVELPENLWQMINLESLEIKNCYNLEEIPEEISKLINLKTFKITRSKINSLPTEFWQLTNLTSLDILVCPRFEFIPVEIGLLTNLESLRISGCEIFENLPDEIKNLKKLTSLRIFNCKNIKLPSAIYNLPNVTFLEIEEDCIISDNSFPKDIPADIRGSVLRVKNSSGETIALFFGTEILKKANKFVSLEEYCEYYDQLYDEYINWDNAGINLNNQSPEEQEEEYRKVLQSLRWDTYSLMRIKVKGYDFLLQKLSRLAYPYHCQMKEIEKSIGQLNGSISWYMNDIQVLRKATEFGLVDQKYLMQEIIRTGWIYDHPEYWLTKKNIGSYVDNAAGNNDTQLVEFLLDYQNKYFLEKGADSLEII